MGVENHCPVGHKLCRVRGSADQGVGIVQVTRSLSYVAARFPVPGGASASTLRELIRGPDAAAGPVPPGGDAGAGNGRERVTSILPDDRLFLIP